MNSGSRTAAEIAAQAAALAGHLERSGVQFLPVPQSDEVERLRAQFGTSDQAENATAESSSSKPSAPAQASSKPSDPPRPISTAPPAAPVRSAPVRSAPALQADPSQQAYPGEPLELSQRQLQLEQMSEEVAACTRCPVLSDCRTQTVFGEGSAQPRVVFFGEGPGADEDRTGRPFVGKAGQLLTKMIEACTFRREDVYILNTVKCRPPGNRNPEPEEIDHCREYYERQLALLRPEYIVCLGAVSSQTLLQSKLSVGRLRGKLHRYFESKVIVTYHPAYLLRTPAAKKAAWEDLQMMLRDAGIDPKAAKSS